MVFFLSISSTCEKDPLSRGTWPQQLLALLSGEASNVMARLRKEEVRSSLLWKDGLLAEAFRQKTMRPKKSTPKVDSRHGKVAQRSEGFRRA